MAKKQQIILTHGSNKPINVTGLTKGEVLVQHAANAEDLALWTLLDDGQTLEAISSKTYVDNRVKSAQKAATTKISKGDDANNNLSIERTVNDDGSTTYTIGLSDVAKQSELTSAVAELSEAIANETQQREAADTEILKTIEDNELVTSQALNELSEGIQTEKSEREAADANLQRQINELSTAVGNISIVEGDEESDMVQVNINKNDGVYTISIDETNLKNKIDRLQTADAELNTAIQTEAQEREAADAAIQGDLTAVEGRVSTNEQAITALQAADAELNTAIQTEAQEREAADNELNSAINSINEDIQNIESNAVYTITVENADTNNITATKTDNTYVFNFDSMVIDGGEY